MVYASCALAGILPPLVTDSYVLADGVYADVAPVDVARGMGLPLVIAVDPGQPTHATEIRNGVQAVMRAMEICHRQHADLRVNEADLVLRPAFPKYIDTLDFGARRVAVVAGARAVRSRLADIRGLVAGRSHPPKLSGPPNRGHQ